MFECGIIVRVDIYTGNDMNKVNSSAHKRSDIPKINKQNIDQDGYANLISTKFTDLSS